MEVGSGDPAVLGTGERGEATREPDEVAAMVRLKALGWGVRRIAAELGCSHMTVRRYLAAGGWAPYRAPGRPRALDGSQNWLAERFRRRRGNADVARQDLARERGARVSLRTIERAVAPLRRELAAEAWATVRFETPPGHRLQVDFGELRVPVEGEAGRANPGTGSGHQRRGGRPKRRGGARRGSARRVRRGRTRAAGRPVRAGGAPGAARTGGRWPLHRGGARCRRKRGVGRVVEGERRVDRTGAGRSVRAPGDAAAPRRGRPEPRGGEAGLAVDLLARLLR